eukprot:10759499-Ditylum_brightwellii.AAC.1
MIQFISNEKLFADTDEENWKRKGGGDKKNKQGKRKYEGNYNGVGRGSGGRGNTGRGSPHHSYYTHQNVQHQNANEQYCNNQVSDMGQSDSLFSIARDCIMIMLLSLCLGLYLKCTTLILVLTCNMGMIPPMREETALMDDMLG